MDQALEATSPFAGDERWQLAQRIANSENFQRSRRARELLLYLCEQALLNRSENLREQAIGCRVFARRADYNPGEDNIVRVEIRNLRKRLEEYFASEGLSEPVELTIPKGSYVPAFQQRPASAVVVSAGPARSGLRGRNRRIAVVLACVLVIAGVVWVVGLFRQQSAAEAASRGPLWPRIFNLEDETLVICADSSLVVAEAVSQRQVTLDDYVRRNYGTMPPSEPAQVQRLLRLTPVWQFTDIADVRIVGALARINGAYWHRVSVRSARSTQLQDFKAGNAVLLGSAESNPWNRVFQNQLNFVIEDDYTARRSSVHNRSPRAGEETMYQSASTGASGESYSTVALVPNLRHTGSVLLISGTTGEGTEAAGEFLANVQTSGAMMRNLVAAGSGKLPYFEVLLKSSTTAGVTSSPEVVTYRVKPDSKQ